MCQPRVGGEIGGGVGSIVACTRLHCLIMKICIGAAPIVPELFTCNATTSTRELHSA
ncbi:hypothetical protein L210DRAFT_942407 [Boletus edulis BED1]|uniref:Uncharacterized protein n=1 Tax=Boletus edulis BED1 TaxID=1328754 RepID=A0AAD4BZE9_BOLED|nr:hypothetical protein L210DRAFT_942407 [Boletus edulis BED1]